MKMIITDAEISQTYLPGQLKTYKWYDLSNWCFDYCTTTTFYNLLSKMKQKTAFEYIVCSWYIATTACMYHTVFVTQYGE